MEVCEKFGYHISKVDARRAWKSYSDMMCAGWMILPEDDDEVFQTVFEQCFAIEEAEWRTSLDE